MSAIEILRLLGKSSVFLLLTGLVVTVLLAALRMKSPRVIYFAWCCVLIQGVLLVQFSIPIRRNVMPSTKTFSAVIRPATESTSLAPSTTEAVAVAHQVPVVLSDAQSRMRDPHEREFHSGVLTRMPTSLLMLWIAGMVVIVVKRVADYLRFLRSANTCLCANKVWRREFVDICDEQSVDANVTLHLSDDVGPAVCRWPREYRVIVPEQLWAQLSRAERLSVLRHEVAHLKRNDLMWNLVLHAFAIPHWFNPMAWIALRNIESNAELACDDIVCEKSGSATEYAKALLAIGARQSPRAVFSAGAGSSHCAARIRRVLSDSRGADKGWKHIVATGVLAVFLVANVMRIDVTAQETSPQKPSADVTDSDVPAEDKVLVVTDADFELAAKRLRDLGGRVRSFHPRTDPKNWVQVILEGDDMKSPADDEAMEAVKLLSTDSRTHFHARHCDFTAKGLATLSGTKISRLELTGANIGDAHLKALSELEHLSDLTLAQTQISGLGFAAIADCRALTSLGLSENAQLSDSSLARLSDLPQLTSVFIRRPLNKSIVAELNRIPHLNSLRLTISDDQSIDAFKDLACLDVLVELTLSGEDVDESMIVFLGNNAPKLQTLYLRGSQGVSVKAAQSLAQMPLQVLALDRTNVTDAGVSLLKPLKQLRWLDLSQTKVTDRSLIAIGNMQKLEHLGLLGTDISESGLDRLRRLENLSYLSLIGTSVKSIPVWMKQRERLYVNHDGGRPMADHPPNAKDDSSLAREVAKFNKEASKHPIGKFEPPLTVDEVIAAIRSWNRNQIQVADETYAIFEQIADTRELPEGANINSCSGWQTQDYHYTVWWIDMDVKTGPNRGYSYRLRARTLSSRKLNP